MIRVVIVDDQPLVRTGLGRILTHRERIEVVAECADGDEVIETVERTRPDAVLMDVRMKRVDGIAATRALRERPDAPPVMMLTTFGDDEILWAALEAGAAGFVLKDASSEELLRATRTIAAGGAWIEPEIAARVIDGLRRERPGGAPDTARLASLTEREREVLTLIAKGYLNGEIAERLHIGEATVKTHVSRVFAKLDARDRAAAIVFAYESGLVNPGEDGAVD